jgi:hypothetical protein
MSRFFTATALAATVFLAPRALAADPKPPCPTTGRFTPDSCSCAAGYSPVIHGNGGAECVRKACPMGTALKDPASCECPTGYEKKKGNKGTVCVARKAAKAQKATAKAGSSGAP